jgi:mannose-6-phosphate isomerase
MSVSIEPIFLRPVFKERIWGGTKLQELFGYAIPSDHTGECWAVSAHPHGQSVVAGGKFAGKTLGQLWTEHPELFAGSKAKTFPLLVKILDASDDLSVQVHPDDEYAAAHENGELGKTECWYVLDAAPGAEIVFGHTATTKEELSEMIRTGQWDRLLRRVPVRQGDFFFVPSGTIHALGKGIVVLETQQSSDTTYRVYDYDRRDAQGNLRELHLDKAIEVTTVPHTEPGLDYYAETKENALITTLVSNSFFTVQKWRINGSTTFTCPGAFTIYSVISGKGELHLGEKSFQLLKGDHFLLPACEASFEIDGKLEIIMSRE